LGRQRVEGIHEGSWPHVLIRCLLPPDHPEGLSCSKPAVCDLEMILVRGHEYPFPTCRVLDQDVVVGVFAEEIACVQDVPTRRPKSADQGAGNVLVGDERKATGHYSEGR